MRDIPANRYNLVADIGGTNTRVALAEGKRLVDDSIRRYSNAGHPDLESVLQIYLDEVGQVDCAGACVAVAGPVRDGVGSMTNLDWTIDTRTLARASKAETVAILNDLQAQSYALGLLSQDKTPCILPRATSDTAEPDAARLVIGIGTGFNAAPIHANATGGRHSAASECGHITLPAVTDEEIALSRHLRRAHGFSAVEDMLSGRGLEHIHMFLSNGPERSAAQIVDAAAEGDDTNDAARAVRMFVSMLARVAGDLALVHLPYGGVYLVGGVARAMVPFLDRFDFAAGFRDKGRFSDFMQNFSVSVIEDDYAALTGCAAYLEDCI